MAPAIRKLRVPIASLRCNFIPTAILIIPTRRKNSKRCSEAYAILADNEKRALYDRFGHAGSRWRQEVQGFDPAIFHDFGDIFGDFFGIGDIFGGGSRRRGRGQRGADLREDITLEFEEAVFGTETKVMVRRHETCEELQGIRCGRGEVASSLPFVRRTRAGSLSAIFSQRYANLPDLPGVGQRHHRSLHEMQRRRPGAAAKSGGYKGPGWGGRWNANSIYWPR